MLKEPLPYAFRNKQGTTLNVDEKRIAELLSKLTVEDKANIVTGHGIWTTRAVKEHAIPAMTVTDGPNGARGGGLMGTGTPTACIPAGSVLGATWDPALLKELGELLGEESQAKGANVLLAPTINLHRNPLGGRNFECYSEDPYLTGTLASAYIQGVQSKNVAVTAKHFVANDSEYERNSIDSQVDERTLREVYLLPFEHAVKEGNAWGIMSSYNRVNGTFASENKWLLNTVLREQWGFDGFVVSDWFAVRSTGPSIAAGLSLEMPGQGQWYGPERIRKAIEEGECTEGELDRIVTDMLKVMQRTGAFSGIGGGEEKEIDSEEHRTLIRHAATQGTVLIKNDGVLPLIPESINSLAVIGPNARSAKIMGGGSAGVRPYRNISPLGALTERLDISIAYAQGCDIDRSTPPIESPVLHSGMRVEFFNSYDRTGSQVVSREYPTTDFKFFGSPAPGVDPAKYSFTGTGTINPEVTGTHQIRLVQSGKTRVLIDGKVIVDATEGDFGKGDDFFGMGSAEIVKDVELTAGEEVPIEIHFSSEGAVLMLGCRIGLKPVMDRDLLAEAEETAAETDAAIVIVGTNDDWETEGRDRDSFALPGDQEELIERISAVNSKTIVVINTGGPHDLRWLDAPNAVLSIGFAGQELGNALVDVLLGDKDPAGRMPTTTPARYEHSPAFLNYPGENSVVRYGEGLYIGHRWFDARKLEPAVPFGHGLSYASFEWGTPRVSGAETTELAVPVTVEIDIENTSSRAGTEVVQLYVEPPPVMLHRPVRELKGYGKIEVPAGQTGTVRIDLGYRSFAYYDPGDQFYATLPDNSPVPRERGQRHTEPGWYVAPGTYKLVVARSATNHHTIIEHTLNGEETRVAP